jgi:hypothetical protein
MQLAANNSNYSQDIMNEWVKGSVEPYMEGLEVKQLPVEEVDRASSYGISTDYIGKVEKGELINVAIRYTKEEQFAYEFTTRALIQYDLKAGQTPYITYKEIPSNLGHGLEKGKYNVTIHLAYKTELK